MFITAHVTVGMEQLKDILTEITPSEVYKMTGLSLGERYRNHFVSCCYNYQGHNNCMQAAVAKKTNKTWSTDLLLHYQTTRFTL